MTGSRASTRSCARTPGGWSWQTSRARGVIYRLWTPTPTDDTLELVFDGEARPRVEVRFRDLFLGKQPGFPRPLVGFGAGGYYCYVPMPFAKSCVVRLQAERMQFYQINYALYAEGTPLASFRPQPTAAEAQLRAQACEALGRAGSDVSRFTAPPGAAVRTTESSFSLQAGASKTIFKAGTGGRIVGLRFSPAEAMAGKSRDLLLKISFDGEEPAIFCPLGDFFGYGWGQPAMQSLLVGTTGLTDYCYFPMPYQRSATVEVVSQRAAAVDLRAEVLHADVPLAADECKFYALWRRENPTRTGHPYTFLDTQGRGHVVGVVLQAQGLEPGKTLFFEGDDQTTIDGQLAIHGTGSEDFFNGGWYDVPDRWERRVSFPLSGCLGYAKHLGRTGAYRLFLGDAYAYRQSIVQTIEHAGEGNNIPTDYASVTYLYSQRRPTASLVPAPLAQRAVVDPREILFPAWWQLPIHAWSFDRASLTRKVERIGGEEVRSLSLSATGEDWFGPHFLSPVCNLPTAGKYAISIEAVKGPAQAVVQLFQNENPAGEPVDLYAPARGQDWPGAAGQARIGRGRQQHHVQARGQEPEIRRTRVRSDPGDLYQVAVKLRGLRESLRTARPTCRTGRHLSPIQNRCCTPRRKNCPWLMAGEARQSSPKGFRATTSNFSPGRTTVIVPSSARK